ncbi:MAG: hypothetical protein PHZ00_00880 [Candidatus Peribacteraceae bacterium]|nr:hypothetical protein [Candidatus Peribacteraceae bacterium]
MHFAEMPAGRPALSVREKVREMESSGALDQKEVESLRRAGKLVENLQAAIAGDKDYLDTQASAIKAAAKDLFTLTTSLEQLEKFDSTLNEKYNTFMQTLLKGEELLRQHQNPLHIRERAFGEGQYSYEQSFEVDTTAHQTLHVALEYQKQVPVFRNVSRRCGLRSFCQKVKVGTQSVTLQESYSIMREQFQGYEHLRTPPLGRISLREENGKAVYALQVDKRFNGTYTVSSGENAFQPFTLNGKGNDQYRGDRQGIAEGDFTTIKDDLREYQQAKTDIDQREALETEATERAEADAKLQEGIDDAKAAAEAETTARAEVDVNQQKAIDENKTAIETETTARTTVDEEQKTAIEANKTAIETETTARTTVDEERKAEIEYLKLQNEELTKQLYIRPALLPPVYTSLIHAIKDETIAVNSPEMAGRLTLVQAAYDEVPPKYQPMLLQAVNAKLANEVGGLLNQVKVFVKNGKVCVQ